MTSLAEFHELNLNAAFYYSSSKVVCHVAKLPESEKFGDLIERYCKLIKSPVLLLVVADGNEDFMQHPMIRQFSQCEIVKEIQVVMNPPPAKSPQDGIKPISISKRNIVQVPTILPDLIMSQLIIMSNKTHNNVWTMHITPALRNTVFGIVCILLAVGQSTRAQTMIETVFASFLLSLSGASFWSAYHSLRAAAMISTAREETPLLQQQQDPQQRLWAVISNNRLCTAGDTDVHVEYRLDLRYNDKSWSVWRRYNDFVRVMRKSALANDLAGDLLPPTSYWRYIWEDRFSANFVNKRTHQLNLFLDQYGQGLAGRRLDAASKEFLGL